VRELSGNEYLTTPSLIKLNVLISTGTTIATMGIQSMMSPADTDVKIGKS